MSNNKKGNSFGFDSPKKGGKKRKQEQKAETLVLHLREMSSRQANKFGDAYTKEVFTSYKITFLKDGSVMHGLVVIRKAHAEWWTPKLNVNTTYSMTGTVLFHFIDSILIHFLIFLVSLIIGKQVLQFRHISKQVPMSRLWHPEGS
jgi:hypothetical protein